MKEEIDPNSKWWYRLAKVIAVVVFIGTVWIPPMIANEIYKYSYLEIEKTKIKCNDGTIILDKSVENYTKHGHYKELEMAARLHCANSHLSSQELREKIKYSYDSLHPRPNYNNYSLILHTETYTYGSRLIQFMVVLITLILTLLFFNLIRTSFLYVAFNRQFLNTFLLKAEKEK